jgi:hypothetical protein
MAASDVGGKPTVRFRAALTESGRPFRRQGGAFERLLAVETAGWFRKKEPLSSPSTMLASTAATRLNAGHRGAYSLIPLLDVLTRANDTCEPAQDREPMDGVRSARF